MQAKIIAGDHLGKIVEIEEMEASASKVRICKGFEGAGQVLWINNSDIDWDYEQEEPTVRKWIPQTLIDWVKYVFAGIAILALIFRLVLWIPGALEETKIRQATNELNEINSLDATDVEIRNQAQERIDSRAERKNELIKTINFKGKQ